MVSIFLTIFYIITSKAPYTTTFIFKKVFVHPCRAKYVCLHPLHTLLICLILLLCTATIKYLHSNAIQYSILLCLGILAEIAQKSLTIHHLPWLCEADAGTAEITGRYRTTLLHFSYFYRLEYKHIFSSSLFFFKTFPCTPFMFYLKFVASFSVIVFGYSYI